MASNDRPPCGLQPTATQIGTMTMTSTSHLLSEFVELPPVILTDVTIRALREREWWVHAEPSGLVVKSAYSSARAAKNRRGGEAEELQHVESNRHLVSQPWGFIGLGAQSIESAQHLVSGADGWLAGYDLGEWGGGLVEFDKAGRMIKQHLHTNGDQSGGVSTRYCAENVIGIHLIHYGVVVLRGLAHLGLNEGAADVYRGVIGAGLEQSRSIPLPGFPDASGIAESGRLLIAIREGLLEINIDDASTKMFGPLSALSTNALHVVGQRWVVREERWVARDGRVEWSPPLSPDGWDWRLGRPNSIFCAGGEIFVGCGSSIIKFSPSAEGLRETRLIHRDDLARIELEWR